VLNQNVGKMFAFYAYFPTLSAEPKWRDSRRPAFPIYLQLVLNLNESKTFALLSIFPYIYC